jgi:hypothetical protein
LLALLALVGAGECAISALAARQERPTLGSRETIWLERTRALRAQAAPVDVVFLGDSTVERAIDDRLFGEASGLTALNLGLTGDLGTYGDYAILKRYLRRLPPPRALVVWHALDVWGRDVDPQLFGFTEPDLRDTLLAVRRRLGDSRNAKALVASPIAALDLVTQSAVMRIPSYRYRGWLRGAAGPAGRDPAELLGANAPHRVLDEQIRQLSGASFRISSESRFWFGALVDLARRHGIVVLAARAPLHERFRGDPAVRELIEESNRALTAFFDSQPGVVQLARENPVFTAGQGYDDKDHVGPLGRSYLSGYYARLVKERLNPPARSP